MFFFEKQSIPYPRMTTRKKLMGGKAQEALPSVHY
jgi:hypothetical protein